MIPIDFEVQRSRGQIGHMNILTTQYLENPLLDRLQIQSKNWRPTPEA
jgi:hypothetical protein